MSVPLVGVVARHLAAGRVRGTRHGFVGVPDAYLYALARAGARAVIVPPPAGAPAAEVLTPFDGLLLTGGGDVEPRRYGAEVHPEVYGLEPERDELELDIIRLARRRAVPTLAICRGAQVANVAFGGTLHQHLPDVDGVEPHGAPLHGNLITHEIRLKAGSRTAKACGRDVVSGTSLHHQAVDRLGDGLVPVGWSPDGLVEALETDDDGWFVAVQWHPEDTAATDPAQQGLFDALVEATRG